MRPQPSRLCLVNDDDCDDAECGSRPSLPELCTGNIDENCDGHNTIGATDVTQYLVDTDGDGYGNDNFGGVLCYQPVGYVEYTPGDLIDCNDTDAAESECASECGVVQRQLDL